MSGGHCADVPMLLTELSLLEGNSNKIVTVPGQVMVEASIGEEKTESVKDL